jgi:four helix bundle protein
MREESQDSKHGSASVEKYQELEVWNLAYGLALDVYQATRGYPSEERFGLTQQLRRASVGVIANLAEGQGRGSRREFRQFCAIARGSQCEVHALLQLSRDLGYLDSTKWRQLADGYVRVGQMLNKLLVSLTQ